MHNHLKIFDSRLTELLTKFCWWTDLRWGKDNVWWAERSATVLGTLQFFVFSLLDGWRLGAEIGIIIPMCFLASLTLFLVSKMLWRHFCAEALSDALKEARSIPNSNKFRPQISRLKRFGIIFILLGTAINSYGLFGAGTSIVFLSYFLCTDPMPPAEKKKRQEEKEMKKMLPAGI